MIFRPHKVILLFLRLIEAALNPALTQLRKESPFTITGGGKTGSIKVGSGRSPFFSRLQSPIVTNKLRSKSVSPQMVTRMSPYSQIVNSNTWSTLYATASLNVEPLIPQLLLQQRWEEEREERCTNTVPPARDCKNERVGGRI